MHAVTLCFRNVDGRHYPDNPMADALCEAFNTSYLSSASLDVLRYHFVIKEN